MQTLYSCVGRNSAEAWQSWLAVSSREFYEGDLATDSADHLDLTLDKALAYPLAVTRLSCRASISFRRSWQHIRNNKVGTRVLWFVQRGALKVVRSQGACIIRAGEAGILDSNAPLNARIICDGESVHDSFQVLVPAHMFQRHLARAESFTGTFGVNTPERQIVQRLLELLVGSGEQMSRTTAEALSESFLEAVADSIGCRDTDLPRRQRLSDKRLADIENFIMMHLTDPDLCYEKVAAGCGISPRYLCYVLKANNTCFSELLWGNRLPKARDLLVSQSARHHLIHEIAFMSGFKSAAHFSRMFKTEYGCSPREYRAQHGIVESEVPAVSVPHLREAVREAA